MLTTRQPKPS